MLFPAAVNAVDFRIENEETVRADKMPITVKTTSISTSEKPALDAKCGLFLIPH
jgi:hypothetical protein